VEKTLLPRHDVIKPSQEELLMSKKTTLKPIAAALGTTFAVSLSLSPIANAAENPFTMTELSQGGYMVADSHGDGEGKCGEGKCGEDKEGEGSCGEDKEGEGSCGEDKEGEGKCGEGKCGEGKCGEDKEGEGKCGEGKCGEDKEGEDAEEAEEDEG
jgi:uncharacterized low-complexity protein